MSPTSESKNINKMSEEELSGIIKMEHKDLDVVLNPPKKGFLRKLFSKNKKMSEPNNKDETKVDNATDKVEIDNTDKLKEEIKSVIEDDIPAPDFKVDGEDITPVVEQIKKDVVENNNKQEVKNSFNESSESEEFKIATFTVRVSNKNVGKVLSKIGEYATQLDGMEEVKHCDLNIVDEK